MNILNASPRNKITFRTVPEPGDKLQPQYDAVVNPVSMGPDPSEQTQAAYEALRQELENPPETGENFKVTMEHLKKGTPDRVSASSQ